MGVLYSIGIIPHLHYYTCSFNNSINFIEMNTNICPKTWMAESILVTIFCCLPFGIVGIIYASKVNSFFMQGNYSEAHKASSNAKKWTKIGFFIGLATIIIYLLIYGITILSILNK